MDENHDVDRHTNDLVNEANLLMLEMSLSGSHASTRAGAPVVRLRELAEQARQAGREGRYKHVIHVAETLENEAKKAEPK